MSAETNRLLYPSIAPRFFGTAVTNLGASGLAKEDRGRRRVVIEKPFGRDLESARSLNRTIHEVFKERQVYRSDHIQEAWSIVDPLLQGGENHDTPSPHIYEHGSWGPQTADVLLSEDGHSWQRVCGFHGGGNG